MNMNARTQDQERLHVKITCRIAQSVIVNSLLIAKRFDHELDLELSGVIDICFV